MTTTLSKTDSPTQNFSLIASIGSISNPTIEQNQSLLPYRQRVRQILDKQYPNFKPDWIVFDSPAPVRDLTDLLLTLQYLSSDLVDAAVNEAFSRASDWRHKIGIDRGYLPADFYYGELIEACFKRLAKTEYAPRYRQLIEQEISELEAQKPRDWHSIDRWQELLTGQRRSASLTAEQARAIAALKAKGFFIDDRYGDSIAADPEAGSVVHDDTMALIGKLPLRELYLKDEPISDCGMQYLRTATELQVVSIENSRITSCGLSALRDHPYLEIVNLSDTSIGDDGLSAIVGAKRLERLILDRTKVTGRGLQYLRELKSLEVLSLNGCKQVTDADLKFLEPLENLEYLTLDSPQISDAGIAQLSKLKKLRELRLCSSKVTPGGIAEFQRRLPTAGVHYYWDFKLSQAPEGVVFTSRSLRVLLKNAKLAIDSHNSLESSGGEDGDTVTHANANSITGRIMAAGNGFVEYSYESSLLNIHIRSDSGVTQLTMTCPTLDANSKEATYSFSVADNGTTLRCSRSAVRSCHCPIVLDRRSGKSNDCSISQVSTPRADLK